MMSGMCSRGQAHRHFAGIRGTHHIVAQLLQAVLDVLAYDAFVLNYEDIGLGHVCYL